jgi:hypothetical protein
MIHLKDAIREGYCSNLLTAPKRLWDNLFGEEIPTPDALIKHARATVQRARLQYKVD